MIAHATPDAPRWTLESPLQEFMAAEFAPFIAERKLPAPKHGRKPCRYGGFLDRLARFLKRPVVIGDLTQDVFNGYCRDVRVDPWRFSRIFHAVWDAAANHVPELPKRTHRVAGSGLPFAVALHGPCKWTKQETQKLLDAAERVGGWFRRRMPDGSTTRIPRAVWFAAYVRIARLTELPWVRIEAIRNGDITPAGTLAARPGRRHAHRPDDAKAFPLGNKTLKAIEPLRGEPDARPFAIVAGRDLLRVYFRHLCRVAKLEKPGGEYQLIMGNHRGTKNPGEPIAFEPAPLEGFGLDSPLADFCERYLFPQNLRIKTEGTRNSYRIMLKQWDEALGRTVRLRDVTVDNIVRLVRYAESQGMAPHTCEQKQNVAVAIANFCTRRRIINWPVELTRYATPEVHPDSWALSEMEALFKACGKMPGSYLGVPAPQWWRAIHLFWWDCGERTGATLSIEADWINLETGVVAIPAAARKGRHKAACYELKPQTVASVRPLVEAARANGRALVFAFPGSAGSFYHHYGKLLKLAGLPNNRRTKPQKLRRTYATFIEKAGGSATEALGHTSRRTTLESYIDPRIVRKPAANLLLPDITGDEPELDEPKGGAA